MSIRPSEKLKEVANELAHLITERNENKQKMLELHEMLKPNIPYSKEVNINPQSPNHNMQQSTPNQKDRVGIWVLQENNGRKSYIRDARFQKEFDSWAKIHQIPAKSPDKKRVAFLGESVARGFLLDPFYTPANILETLLNSQPNELKAEVIDLAKTNLTLSELTELCTSSLKLDPDAIVIFAGNNWMRLEELPQDVFAKIASEIQSEGDFEKVKRYMNEQYIKSVNSFMQQLNQIKSDTKIPVVFIIPEFNLADYRITPEHRLVSWSKIDKKQWVALKKTSEEALQCNKIEEAEQIIQEMIKQNPWSPLGYELLSKCKLKQHFYSEATECLRKALEISFYSGQTVPGCISVIRETILEDVKKYQIPTVDLPELFSQYTSGKPPGRKLFLDYCHLTSKGIQISMISTTQILFQILANKNISTDALAAKTPSPEPPVEARSHFFGAIHNAHRGDQPPEILFHHCQKALDISRDVKEIMEHFVEMASHRTIWSLNKNCEKMFEKREQKQFNLLLQPRNLQTMDINLVNSIVEALEKQDTKIRNHVLTIRKKEHGFLNGRKKINLLDSYYYLTSYDTPFIFNSTGYYREHNINSHFFLFCETDYDILIKLVYRVPNATDNQKNILFNINNMFTKELPSTQKWNEMNLEIPRKALNDGLNNIILEWPHNSNGNKRLIENFNYIAPEERMNILNEIMYPVNGELHLFTAERFHS